MISIVLYGRNDSYGYNLHKRAALGLNCMAEVLSHPDDEILFVDYNTPDDHPTFPEAIADTLTARAAARLRVLRVRPPLHDRFAPRTHLKALEPVARNVAVRRSNPRNRWILSTNTDMIFVPRTAATLSDIAAELAPGFYHLPRFELPESLWEGFDRRDPAGVIESVRRFGRTLFLNEIVYGAPSIKYDAPGDFQLVARDDLFRIHGFNEEMLLGWHVDSNLAKRLFLMYGVVGDVVDRLFGYHCDHTRQITPMHRHGAPSNDQYTFIDSVTEPALPAQAATWGCPGDEIEEIRLDASASRVYLDGLAATLEGAWEQPAEAFYTPDSFGRTAYDARHVLPFLVDLFASVPRTWSVAWIGARPDTFRMFCRVWRSFGGGPVALAAWAAPLIAPDVPAGVRIATHEALDEGAHVYVFDFGAPSESGEPLGVDADPRELDRVCGSLMRESFRELVRAERARMRAGGEPRRIVCVDAVHNPYETLTREEITVALMPFASRLRHGYALPDPLEESWIEAPVRELLDTLPVGESGVRTRRGIEARFGRRGYLFAGPETPVPPGDYEVEISFRPRTPMTAAALVRPVIVEVLVGAHRLARHRVHSLFGTRTVLPFAVPTAAYYRREPLIVQLMHGRSVDFLVTAVTLRRVRARPPLRTPSEEPQLTELLRTLRGRETELAEQAGT
jgi:hypothetical protein